MIDRRQLLKAAALLSKSPRAEVIPLAAGTPVHWRDYGSRFISCEEAEAEPPCQRLFPTPCASCSGCCNISSSSPQ